MTSCPSYLPACSMVITVIAPVSFRNLLRRRPCIFKLIHGLARSGKLLSGNRCLEAGFFLQLQDQRQARSRRGLQELDRGGPIDSAVGGREVLVLLAVIVMEMHGGDEIAK